MLRLYYLFLIYQFFVRSKKKLPALPYFGKFYNNNNVYSINNVHELSVCINVCLDLNTLKNNNIIELNGLLYGLKKYGLFKTNKSFPCFNKQKKYLAHTNYKFYNEKIIHEIFNTPQTAKYDHWRVLLYLTTLKTLNSIQIYDYHNLGQPKKIFFRPKAETQVLVVPSILTYENGNEILGSNIPELDNKDHMININSTQALIIMSDHANNFGNLNTFSCQVSALIKNIEAMGGVNINCANLIHGYGICPTIDSDEELTMNCKILQF
jgi:hypothetical protein